MKSTPLSDAAAATTVVAEIPGFPQPRQKTAEPFGAILEEATADSEAEAPEESAIAEEKKKSQDELPAIPLAYFCPPPLPTIQEPTTTAQSASDSPTLVEGVTEDGEAMQPIATKEASAEPTNASAVDLVTPKAAATAAAKSDGAIKLDPKLFQPVSEPIEASIEGEIKPVEAPLPEQTPVTNASHGTLVAQLENRVKNSGKQAEIAPPTEQKMPVREVFRRAVRELDRVDRLQLESQPAHVLTPDFEVGPSEVIPVKAVEATHLVEKIRTEVTNLCQRGDSTVTVTLRPDSGTQLSLNLSISRDGTVHAQARCERGDFQTLNAQWPQLQQSLAAHGIRIADLSNNNTPQHQNQNSAQNFSSFDRGQNSPQREQRETASFEKQLGATKKISQPKPQSQRAATATSGRRWQSWA